MLESFYQFCQAWGLSGLFMLSFSASTFLPLGSEWLFAGLYGQQSVVEYRLLLVVVATVGNTAGGYTSYLFARWGVRFFPNWREKKMGQLSKKYPGLLGWCGQYGGKISFFSWLPGIGDIIPFFAGVLGVRSRSFIFYSVMGRFLRYAILGLMVG